MVSVLGNLKKSNYWKNTRRLFIFKRRPKAIMSKEYVALTGDAYYEALNNEGFISPKHWTQDNLSDYPIIEQDIKDLEEHLLPTFWRYTHLAKYYQNRFYLYQWVFMFGAFLTTILAVFTSYFDNTGYIVPMIGMEYVRFYSVMTMIVSAITSYFTLLSNQSNPRNRWANYRRLSEELRMTYFKFLARLEPYDKENRVTKMREQIMAIKERERGNG
jgi:hypothetical protein